MIREFLQFPLRFQNIMFLFKFEKRSTRSKQHKTMTTTFKSKTAAEIAREAGTIINAVPLINDLSEQDRDAANYILGSASMASSPFF